MQDRRRRLPPERPCPEPEPPRRTRRERISSKLHLRVQSLNMPPCACASLRPFVYDCNWLNASITHGNKSVAKGAKLYEEDLHNARSGGRTTFVRHFASTHRRHATAMERTAPGPRLPDIRPSLPASHQCSCPDSALLFPEERALFLSAMTALHFMRTMRLHVVGRRELHLVTNALFGSVLRLNEQEQETRHTGDERCT